MDAPRRVALDFDGVVLESVRVKLDAFHAMFADLPQAREIDAYLDKTTGISRYVKFRHIHEVILRVPYGPALEKELDARYSGMVLQGVLRSPFVPGAEEFLAWCPAPIDVVSAMPLKELEVIVAERGIAARFQELHGSPGLKADQLRSILASRALAPRDVLFVGDSAEDQVAARDAGVRFVGRVNRDHPFDFPEPRVDDLRGLKALLEPAFARSRA